MTSNFIDQFGFNDEKFADQDDIGKWVSFPVPLSHALLLFVRHVGSGDSSTFMC